MTHRTPLQAIRRHCVICSGDSQKAVRYCPCDGIHSSRCELWLYRFGKRPQSLDDQRLVIPACMPARDIALEQVSDDNLLPAPAGTKPPKRRQLTPERKVRLTDQLAIARRVKLEQGYIPKSGG